MKTRRILLVVAGIVVVLAAGYAIWKFVGREDSPLTVYRNNAYEYTFAYPASYDLIEYNSANVAIGDRTDGGIKSVVDISAITSEEGVQYSNFKDFLIQRVSVLCAADGPNTSISCGAIESEEAFVASTGLEGVMFYLTEITTTPSTGAQVTGRKGPFYAFDLSGANPGAQFTAVVVRPPTPMPNEEVDAEFLRAIANTMQIQNQTSE